MVRRRLALASRLQARCRSELNLEGPESRYLVEDVDERVALLAGHVNKVHNKGTSFDRQYHID